MKTRKLAALMTAAATSLFAGAAMAQEVTLKVHHFLAANSNQHMNLLTPWCDKIAKESNNRLKCQIYPSMQLGGTPPQLFDQARDGVADMVWTLPTYQAGRFTKSEAFELPFLTKNATTASPALWEYVQKNALDEFKGTKIIFMHMHDGATLHFGKVGPKTLEDLKGLKVRAPSRIGGKVIQALGMVPVQMPAPQVPESIAKGVVDGAMIPWEVMTPLKMQEITKFHVEVPAGKPKPSNSIFVLVMNQAKYDSLPADLKKVIDANSGLETSKWAGKVFDAPEGPARKLAQEQGGTFITISPAEYERWRKATDQVDDEWMKDVNAKGGNGKALYDEAVSLLKKYGSL
ncbi:TRAP transporter substrate-binding protein [Sulfurisoma sediminicola]|uniref:TRAP-type C4-dicarboxylate transport system substrate-binding protein n=1 Tax=Sulfurisoma sediminicola TaxID=1381557 RepID=A0A497XEU9_9PROT|nr:TRAP transporter substrate-binding protein [Sulfurisoma sediminicola]RLJ65234.1 TRAP-type C4-dicarboxylate transport system substrate-binding protein [Sulfurisoma sediminicola]